MREIKFRAFDKDDKRMFNDVDVLKNGSIIFFESDDEGEPIHWYNNYGENYEEEQDYMVVMQYTGLKDKNDKEIYEGDIVTYGAWDIDIDQDWRHSPALVEYKEKEAAFHLTRSCDIRLRSGLRELEVLGNIYENPELLGNPDVR